MADVKSKNPYELLGNDDEDSGSKAPIKTVDKALPRSSRRNAPEPGASGRGQTAGGRGTGRGAGRGALSGSDAAYNDSAIGSRVNRNKPTEEGGGDRAPRRGGTRGGQRGGRGGTFRDNRDDRHWKGLPNDHQKQADQAWGGNTGNSEWADERAGEAIAKSEAKEGDAAAEEEAEPEPEDNSKSYDDYLAEQAQKRLNLGGPLALRKANEGSKPDKKWSQAKAIDHDEEDVFMAPQGGKSSRTRERKEKQVVEIDHRFVEQPRERGGYRGDRGGGRSRGEGGRGRGGEGRGRGRGEGRGEYRGRADAVGRGRGGPRGGGSVNVADKSAFPSLGS